MAKVIILAPSFYPNKGGVEKHLENVAKNMVARGRQVVVLVRYSIDFPKSQKVFGAEVKRMPKSIRIHSMAIWLAKNKNLFDGAVIHSHDYFPFALRRLLKNNRWVHTFHGYEGYPLDPNAIKSRQEVIKQVDYSFCVGSFIEKWYGTKCNEVMYGAAEKFKDPNRTIRWDYIFYGRFEEDTGFEKYIKAFKLIQQKDSDSRLIVVGDGSKKQWAQEFVKKNNLKVEFRKSVGNVNDLLYQSKVAFVSGYLSIIECGLAKKPIVAYYGTPIKKDYLMCHPMSKNFAIVSSEKEIATAAAKALKPNAKQIESLYNWSHAQTWERIVDQYEKAYQS